MAEDEVLTEDGAEEFHAPNDAVILSYSQMPVNYNAVPKVWLTHPDSTEEAPVLVPFTYGEAMSKTVEPDFSNGDMAIEVPEGELITELAIIKPENLKPENIAKDVEIAGVIGNLEGGDTEEVSVDLNMADGDQIVTPTETGKSMSKVTVKKPDTLIPGNIAEGVDIAGIIGSLVAGGGGGAKFATGMFYSSATPTVSHNLGAVPDLVIAYQKQMATQGKINAAFGFSKAFREALGLDIGMYGVSKVASTSTKMSIYRSTSNIEDAQSGYNFINSATDTTVKFGATNTSYQMATTSQPDYYGYIWIAIAGLT
jgi:hypothetical protein